MIMKEEGTKKTMQKEKLNEKINTPEYQVAVNRLKVNLAQTQNYNNR